MPTTTNKKNALKALRQSKKLAVKHAAVKENIQWLIKKSEKAIAGKNDAAKGLVTKVEKAVDKAVQKNILKENTGRRKKSRLVKKLNAAFGTGKKN